MKSNTDKKVKGKQCNYDLDSSNYNIKAHFYCLRMNSLKNKLCNK